ncbi:hypothetical protein PCASD_11180 [Puccinia coronata f. sp. avenae]|uniref:Uncharacterized protein n=1 Tax=Puccinia coronata f. sp. avenae TaxID=200324 RepID=A0A2N5TA11_9BASI|nr:hypothetical protein PCASD_11180 [Puccinia coronata f. sp. avenae]
MTTGYGLRSTPNPLDVQARSFVQLVDHKGLSSSPLNRSSEAGQLSTRLTADGSTDRAIIWTSLHSSETVFSAASFALVICCLYIV